MVEANKVVYVLGTTGVGKSKLAIQIAKHIQGEIVNADSMQIYQGQGIMTAQPQQQDLQQVPHHLYGQLPQSTTDFTVQKYRELALDKIREIQSRGKVAVVCGGTNYYIESIMFTTLESKFDPEDFAAKIAYLRQQTEDPVTLDLIASLETNVPLDAKQLVEDRFPEGRLFHGLLQKVDPSSANFLHPNDRRKLVNALFAYFKQQQGVQQLRHPSVFIQVKAHKSTLKTKIDLRIQDMVRQGGLREAFELFDSLPEHNFQKGILQSIGYKEFYDCFKHPNRQQLLLFAEQGVPCDGQDVVSQCIQKLQSKTFQYASYQLKWLTSRFKTLNLKVLQIEDFANYQDLVQEAFLHVEQGTLSVAGSRADKKSGWEQHQCEDCQQLINGSLEWQKHLQTKKHKHNKLMTIKRHSGLSDREFYSARHL